MAEDYHYKSYRFSVTCHTNDLAVVHCLRALCQHSEVANYKQIGWGGTGEGDWRKAGNKITLRLTKPAYRDEFEKTAHRLLPKNSWEVVKRNDNDPAQRRRK
ncbi:MAG: hypothetical protein KKE44_04580 [Proteobacteria bacterium]|nr:hypothetical protein [Pseudomonadota bacterium]MBU1582007.1 hypothetical protein [Pseudomonadota bacterium]MBU2455781.1 hypothetical protein [Pseudomonadota bacterium]MBU2628379.1 hypothetical protein [Pseudomonadota bacterium]